MALQNETEAAGAKSPTSVFDDSTSFDSHEVQTRCNWCHKFTKLCHGAKHCSTCDTNAYRVCRRCKRPFPSADYFTDDSARCNSCQRKYIKERERREMKKQERIQSGRRSSETDFEDSSPGLKNKRIHSETRTQKRIKPIQIKGDKSTQTNKQSTRENHPCGVFKPPQFPIYLPPIDAFLRRVTNQVPIAPNCDESSIRVHWSITPVYVVKSPRVLTNASARSDSEQSIDIQHNE